MPDSEPQILDGFTYSMNRLYLPISFSTAALAQMEVIRQAKGYQWKAFPVPSPEGVTPSSTVKTNWIPAYGQLEQQVKIEPGSYLYGWSFYAGGSTPATFHINVTDACTETPLTSDYLIASLLDCSNDIGHNPIIRGPALLAQPRLISEPGLVNVEIYNNSSEALPGQLVLFCAVPRPSSSPSPYALSPSNPGWDPNGERGPRY